MTLSNLEELKKSFREIDQLEEVLIKIGELNEIKSKLSQIMSNKKRKTSDSLGGGIYDIQYLKIN